jgi:hypothetical protein
MGDGVAAECLALGIVEGTPIGPADRRAGRRCALVCFLVDVDITMRGVPADLKTARCIIMLGADALPAVVSRAVCNRAGGHAVCRAGCAASAIRDAARAMHALEQQLNG